MGRRSGTAQLGSLLRVSNSGCYLAAFPFETLEKNPFPNSLKLLKVSFSWNCGTTIPKSSMLISGSGSQGLEAPTVLGT